MKHLVVVMVALLTGHLAFATEYHVAVHGNDANDGSLQKPFRTISAAANVALPGDVVTVHEGTYRERINPPRGGESDSQRIVFRAAPGEKVEIKGSELVKHWVEVKDCVWKVSIPNSFFGGFNPFNDLIHGDWFVPLGRQHHTGAVYLNGDWLTEAANLDTLMKPSVGSSLWYAVAENEKTTIWAQFNGANPNEQVVEINVRETVFYPEKTGINFITVRGFTVRDAATPWAPPTAEQIGAIGTNWSKGWIIENCDISHSVCSGIALGKHGDEFDNTSANSAEGYIKTIERAFARGWNRETIGHHLIRNNTIHDCEQAGIVGSLGAVFSRVEGNHIYNIFVRRLFDGAEMAGIKFHAAIDVVIRHNRIHNTIRGMWMDWMAQGTRITGNLCYDNDAEDIFFEVDHGPFLVDNNLLLSAWSIHECSEGGAFAHNLIAGEIGPWVDAGRETPFHKPHATTIAGMATFHDGEHRYFNNVFVPNFVDRRPKNVAENKTVEPPSYGLGRYTSMGLSVRAEGNVYCGGAHPYRNEADSVVLSCAVPKPMLVEEGERVFLKIDLGACVDRRSTALVTAARLGKARVPDVPFENPDGSPVLVNGDYFGNARNQSNPTVGPFEHRTTGVMSIRVW